MSAQVRRLFSRTTALSAILGMVFLWTAAAVPSQWLPFDGAQGPGNVQTHIQSLGLDQIILEVNVPGIWLDNVATPEGDFVRLEISDGGVSGDIGHPQIPAIRELIAVPDGGSVSWEVIDRQEHLMTVSDLATKPLYPQQPPVEKRPGARENAPFRWDRNYYSQDKWLPESNVDVGDRGYLRAYSFVPVTIYPITVNPERPEVRVINHLTIRIRVQGADMAATRDRIRRYGTLGNRSMAHGLLQIPPSLESTDELPLPPLGYLIICDPLYEGNADLDNFVDWKAQKGYQVTVATTNETGTSRDQVKAYIQAAYDQWEIPPVQVLLIGDTPDIPYYVGSTQDNPCTDLYFACLEGTDYFADVGIGRLSVMTPEQLGNSIQKTLNFERVEWTGNNDWENHAAFMASNDNWQISEGTHNFVISNYLDPEGYTYDRYYSHTYGANIGQVIAALNQGRSLLVYSGHGSITTWADGPAMNQTQVRDLYNSVYPFVCSHACETGQYTFGECFGETWIRDPEAGMAFWGSSVTSYWDEDDILERRMFEGFFDNQTPGDDVNFTWLSGMTNYAKARLYQYYGNTGTVRRYFEMYNILGDPSVDVWTMVPRNVTVNHNPVIHVGDQSVVVSVDVSGSPVANAMVCVMGDDVWGSAYTNASGTAEVTFDQAPQSPGALNIYVTGHNLHPEENSVQVITESGPFVAYQSYQLHDPTGNNDGQLDYDESVTLDLTVHNMGSEPASDVTVSLRSANNYVTITDSTEVYGNIAVEQEITIQNAFAFQASPDMPDNEPVVFSVVAASNEGSWETHFTIMAHAPHVECTSIVVDDATGNNNGILDPGETADLDITVRNNGSTASADMSAQVTTLEALVSILSGAGSFSALDPGAQGTETFSVMASSACPLAYHVGLILRVNEASTGRQEVERFEVIIGDEVMLPSGPDSYGYYAYDSHDIMGAPEYDWVEINSQLGGPGTLSGVTGDDQTAQFNLPFTFSYYGTDYNNISICSNGWISMGTTSNHDYENSGIPNASGPPAMIAPLWDDLNPQSNGTIWIWADTDSGRYIVEYYQLAFFNSQSIRNTFQVILYDPDVYPTASGDGMIRFQYQTSNNLTDCTVGIENPNQSDGIQYLYNGTYDDHGAMIVPESAILFTTGATQAPGTVSGTVALLGGSGDVQDVEITIGTVTASPLANGAYSLTNVPSGLKTLVASLYGYGTVTMPNLMVPAGGSLTAVNINLPYLEPPTDLAGSVENGSVLLQWQETGFLGVDHAGRIAASRVSRNGGLDESLEFVGYRIYRDAVCVDSLIQEMIYEDVPPELGTYDYYVTAEFTMGESDSTNHVSVLYQGENVPQEAVDLLPDRFALRQNYPNPFNPETTIPYDLPQEGKVTIDVFNVLGQKVGIIVDQEMPAGFHRITWDGSQMASGVYFYRIVVRQHGSPVFEDLRKAIMVR
jgi:hypothetical protein